MVEAILPVVLCLLLGKALARTPLFGSTDWASLEKLMFWIFLPLLIFKSITQSEFDISTSVSLAIVFFVAQATIICIALVHAFAFGVSNKSMTSLFQSAARWNNIIPIAVASTSLGMEGMNVVAVALAVMVPVANISCIFVLQFALKSGSASFSRNLVAVIKNPLIVACLVGFLVKISGYNLPQVFMNFSSILASSTLGVGLICVGAGTNIVAMRREHVHVIGAALTKLVMMPVVVYVLCLMFDIEGIPLTAAVLCAATPTAMQSYVVARNMGGDAELMGSIISAQHILALGTLPLFFHATYSF